MTSPERAQAVAELDAITDRLVPAAEGLAKVLDRVMASRPGTPCPWCMEDNGWCVRTGGPHPCEYEHEYAAALDDVYTAPERRIGATT